MAYKVTGGWACLNCGSVFELDWQACQHQSECEEETRRARAGRYLSNDRSSAPSNSKRKEKA